MTNGVDIVKILRTVADALEDVTQGPGHSHHHRPPRVELPISQPSITCGELLSLCANALAGAHPDANPLVHPGALSWSRPQTPSVPAASSHSLGASMISPPRLMSTTSAGARHGDLHRRSSSRGGATLGSTTRQPLPPQGSSGRRAQTAPSGASRNRGTRSAGMRRSGFKGTSVLENAAMRAKEDARIRLETFRAARMEKARAEGNGDLLRSLRVLDDHERDRALMSARQSTEREQHFQRELRVLDDAYASAKARLNDEWDAKADELEAELEDIATRVAVTHEAEYRGLEATLTERPPARPHFSTTLLDLRRTQELQSRAGLAELSIATKARADEMEAEETAKHEASIIAAAERQRKALRERHAKETRQVECRATDRRVRFERERKHALSVLQQKFANHKRDIEHAKILEANAKPRPTEGKIPLSARNSAAATARASELLAREK